MRMRTSALSAAVGLLVLTGCSDEEPTDSAAPTIDSVLTPTADASEDSEDAAVETESGDGPTLEVPSGLPTELPTDLDLNESCAEIEKGIEDAFGAIEEAMADPASAPDLFAELAQVLRDAGADSEPDVAAAAEGLAAVYDDLGESLAGGQPPDVDRLTEAVEDFQAVCS